MSVSVRGRKRSAKHAPVYVTESVHTGKCVELTELSAGIALSESSSATSTKSKEKVDK